MQDLKRQIYVNIERAIDGKKNALIAWNGSAYSSFLWWFTLKDMSLEIPLVFIDDDGFDIKLYQEIARSRKKYGLDVTTQHVDEGEIEKKLKEIGKSVGVLLTGRPAEFGHCPLPEGQETWNLIRMMNTPFYKTKRNMLS